MTEKQKMLAGELYLARDQELGRENKRARRLLRTYNSTTEEESQRRQEILQELFSKVGNQIEIVPRNYSWYLIESLNYTD